MQARRFLLAWLVLVPAILLAVAAANVAVDAYLIFGTPRIAGFNQLKPGFVDHEATVKVNQVARVAPRTILLGTSKVQVALNPEDPLWPQASRPVFNFGVAGSRVYSQGLYLQ